MTSEQTLSVARRYAAAVVSGSDDDLRELFDPKAEIWHNTDGKVQTPEDNLRLGRWLRRKAPGIAFTEIRQTLTEYGFVQQHRMVGDVPGVGRLDVASCLVVTLSADAVIVRAEEYLDSAGLAALMSPEPSRGSH